MPQAKIDELDVSEHIANMYDALVNSMDWGSGFLDTETKVSVLLIGELMGFPDPGADTITPDKPSLYKSPYKYDGTMETAKLTNAHYLAYKQSILDGWKAEARAMIEQMKRERFGTDE